MVEYNPNNGSFTWIEVSSNAIKVGDTAGCCRPDGYLLIAGQRAHRLAFAAMGEPLKSSDVVDHINRDPADNRWDNLRLVSKAQNSYNTDLKSNNKSGHTGVSWDKTRAKWRATLVVGAKQLSARFDELEDAVLWRKQTEKATQVSVYCP